MKPMCFAHLHVATVPEPAKAGWAPAKVESSRSDEGALVTRRNWQTRQGLPVSGDEDEQRPSSGNGNSRTAGLGVSLPLQIRHVRVLGRIMGSLQPSGQVSQT